MANNNSTWISFLVFLNILSTLLIVFKMPDYLFELMIMCAFIIVAIIGVGGLMSGSRWGVALMSLLFAAVLSNLMYLYLLNKTGYLFSLAFVSAIAGFVSLASIRVRKRPASKPKVQTYQVRPAPKKKASGRTSSGAKSASKKSKGRKRKPGRPRKKTKKSSSSKGSARKRTAGKKGGRKKAAKRP